MITFLTPSPTFLTPSPTMTDAIATSVVTAARAVS